MKLRLKSMQEIWHLHKNLLRGADSNLPIDWNSQLPGNEEALNLLGNRAAKWMKPINPIQLNNSKLEETIAKLTPQIEQVWGFKALEMPALELVAPDEFLTRVNHYMNLVNRMFGYGNLLGSPPGMYLATSHKTLVLPTKFVVRELRARSGNVSEMASVLSSDCKITVLPWDNAQFEQVLSEEISHVLFRQARGEWGKDYVKSMKAVGPEAENRISKITEISAQIAKEGLCTQHPEWGFYVVMDAIIVVWSNRFARADYVGLDALSRNKTLVRSAMLDYISIRREDEVEPGFFSTHPFNSRKQEIFNTGQGL